MAFVKKTATKTKIAQKAVLTTKVRKPRAPLPTWEPPADFKPFFAELTVYTDKDGLLCTKNIAMIRYVSAKAKLNPVKVFNMVEDDPMTVMAVFGRFSAKTFITNVAKRFPANTGFKLLLRVAKTKPKDGGNPVLRVGVKSVTQINTKKVVSKVSGATKLKTVETLLDNTNPISRKFRGTGKILGSAFQNVLAPRVRTREENKALREAAGLLPAKAKKKVSTTATTVKQPVVKKKVVKKVKRI